MTYRTVLRLAMSRRWLAGHLNYGRQPGQSSTYVSGGSPQASAYSSVIRLPSPYIVSGSGPTRWQPDRQQRAVEPTLVDRGGPSSPTGQEVRCGTVYGVLGAGGLAALAVAVLAVDRWRRNRGDHGSILRHKRATQAMKERNGRR